MWMKGLMKLFSSRFDTLKEQENSSMAKMVCEYCVLCQIFQRVRGAKKLH